MKTRIFSIPRLICLVSLGATLLQQLKAASLVTTNADSGPGSLRQVIANASSGDTIAFSSTLSAQTILLTSGELLVTNNVTIDASSLPVGITIDGNRTSRIFEFAAGTTNVVKGLRLTNGAALGSAPLNNSGGAILLNSSAWLTIVDSALSGNFASAGGGAIRNLGKLMLNNSSLSNNVADNGGGIFNMGLLLISNSLLNENSAAEGGGGIYNPDHEIITITNSILSGNSAIYGGGIAAHWGQITIINSTLHGNAAATGDGGGIYSFGTNTIIGCTLSGNVAPGGAGGAMMFGNSKQTLINSTLSGNSALLAGGVFGNSGALTFINSTLSGNSATHAVFGGAGIRCFGTLTLTNCIVAANITVSSEDPNIFGAFTGSHNLTSGDPLLAQLGDYGGPTQTMPPLAGSPAIDAGDDDATNNFAYDQRGYPRLAGSAVDIGAVEFQNLLVVVSANDVTATSATLHGTVCPNGLRVTAWFTWRDTEEATETNGTILQINQRTNCVPLRQPISGLVPGRSYVCKLWVYDGTAYSHAMGEFTTLLSPTVITLAASTSTSSNATLTGTANLASLPGAMWFEWGTTTNYGNATSATNVGAGQGSVPVSNEISELTGLIDYHYRLVVSNAAGVFYGGDNEVNTPPGREVADGIYVNPTIFPPHERGTPVTATATGAWTFPATGEFRIPLTSHGQPTSYRMEILKVTHTKADLKFPAVPVGPYGFMIQWSNKFTHVWEVIYESGPAFFQVSTNWETYVFYPDSRSPYVSVVPPNPFKHIGVESLIVTGAFTGSLTVAQQLLPDTAHPSSENSGVLTVGWTKNFRFDGEGDTGVRLTFGFPMKDWVTYEYSIPYQFILDFPTNVCAGQNLSLKARAFQYLYGGWLRAKHDTCFGTTHKLWLNAPYDTLPPLNIESSFEPDRLRVSGKIPVAPFTDWTFPTIDTHEPPWRFLPYAFIFDDGNVSIGELAGLPDFLENLVSYSDVTLGGARAYTNSGPSIASHYDRPISVSTVGAHWPYSNWADVPNMWQAKADLIYLTYAEGLPYISEAAGLLSCLQVELWLNGGLRVQSRDAMNLKPPLPYLAVSIPSNATNWYTVSTNLSLEIDASFVTDYLHKLFGDLNFDMPKIDSKNLARWDSEDFWRQSVSNNCSLTTTFPISKIVWVTDAITWNSTYLRLPVATPIDLICYPLPEAAEYKRALANISFSEPPPPPMVPSIILGTFPVCSESEFELGLTRLASVGGSVSANPPPVNGGYSNGTVVTLTAQPASGFQFVAWSGDATGTNNTIMVTMDRARSVTPIFRGATLNPFEGSASIASWSTWPAWGLQFPLVWDTSETTESPAVTGSLRYKVPFSGAAQDQLMSFGTFANRWLWDDGIVLDGTQFGALSFDIKVAPGTAPNIFGNYGDFEVGLLHVGSNDWERIPLPGFTLPLTNDWVHIVSQIDPSAPGVDSIVGMYIKLWSGGRFTNTFTFNVDNLQLEARPAYEAAVIANHPLAYYRLNEIGSGTAVDSWAGHDGTYQATAFAGLPGMREPVYGGFESQNSAVHTTSSTTNFWVSAPFGSLATNTVTFTAWIRPLGNQSNRAGILMTRGNGAEGGLGCNNQQMLAYAWNDNTTWDFVSGLVVPTNQWSFVAMVIEPTQAILHLCNAEGHRSATNAISHSADVFGNNWRIGSDAADSALRGFNGMIDEVAVFKHALASDQIVQLYTIAISGPPVELSIQRNGFGFQLSWARGTLQQAETVNGTYSDVSGAVSPYTVTPATLQKFYRVKLR